MKIKKYLLYLLILIVAGTIAVSIFYTLRDNNKEKARAEQQEMAENQEINHEESKKPAEDTAEDDTGEDIDLNEAKELENYYLNQGVRGTKIRAEVAQTGENAFSVAFNISEGEKVKIDKIVVTGNVITKKSTIRREFRIKEGDYAFYESIRETKRRLERLGIFTEVKIEEILKLYKVNTPGVLIMMTNIDFTKALVSKFKILLKKIKNTTKTPSANIQILTTSEDLKSILDTLLD